MPQQRWITLDGVVNMRDLGGLPTRDGRSVQPRRLIRSDNLQDLSPMDVSYLIDELGVSDIIDLRSHLEYDTTGPGPLRATPLRHHHHSFLRDDVRAVTAEEALAVRPERRNDGTPPPSRRDEPGQFWIRHYLGYLEGRPDSVTAALDAVATAPGATVVHCAAGKDRTGTVVALALDVAGVPTEEVVADYVASAERIERILDRLVGVAPYATTLEHHTVAEQTPRAEAMTAIMGYLHDEYGGAAGWLLEHGWDRPRVERLRAKLLD